MMDVMKTEENDSQDEEKHRMKYSFHISRLLIVHMKREKHIL